MKSFFILLLLSIISYANLVGSIEGELNNNGRLTYTLPLSLPKGEYKLSPNLSINYIQGSSNSELGLGFNLGGLSKITRCQTNKKIDGYSSGLRYDEQSKYCLDGVRLIRQNDNTFRLYNNPKIKIVAQGDLSNPSFWEVYKDDGFIYIYGQNNGVIKNDKGKIAWKISSIQDRLNHKIDFYYKNINGKNYINYIVYNPYKIEFIYENRKDSLITYDTANLKKNNLRLKQIIVKLNNKLFSSYKINYDNYKYSRIKSISWCDKYNKCLRPVVFDYKKETNDLKSDFIDLINIDSMQNFFVADINNDGYNDICYYDNNLICNLNDGNGNFNNSNTWSSNIKNIISGDKAFKQAMISTLMPIDLNNDLLIDYCIATNEGIYCGLNLDNNKFKQEKYWSKEISINDAFRFIDINQDKKLDLCRFSDKGLECSLNNGDKFGKLKLIDSSSKDKLQLYKEFAKANYTDKNKIPQPQLIDINGDGNSDLCGFNIDENSFYCKLGSGYDKINKKPLFGNWIKWGSDFPMNNEKSLERFNRTFRFIDLNNDKLPDICYRKEANYICRLNKKISFGDEKVWLKLPSSTWPIEISKKDEEPDHNWIIKQQEGSIALEDINGDGLPDFRSIVGEEFVVAYNNGHSFENLNIVDTIDPDINEIEKRKKYHGNWLKSLFGLSTTVHTLFVTSSYGPIKMVPDLDGKNNKEFCYRSNYGLSCIKINNNPIALLEKVTNSLGKSSKIEYGNLLTDNLYIKGDDNKNSNIKEQPSNLYVVKSIISDNGIGKENSITYKYKEFLNSLVSGALGYKSIIAYNKSQNSKTETIFYREDSVLNGKIKEIKNYINDKLITKEEYKYEIKSQNNPYYRYAILKEKISYKYDLNGDLLVKKITKYDEFTKFNNPQTIIETTEDISGLDYTVTTKTTYLEDEKGWLIGKPLKIIVTHNRDGSQMSKTTQMSYNSKGELTKEIFEPGSNNQLIKEYKFNNSHTQLQEIVKDSKGNSRVITKKIDSLGREVEVKNALNQTTKTTYDNFCLFNPKEVVDANGLKVKYYYDSQCRLIKKEMPNGVIEETKYEWSNGVDRGVDFNDIGFDDIDVSVYMVTTTNNIGNYKRVYYDSLEREIRTITKGFNSKDVITDIIYNNKGQVIAKTLPYFKGKFAGDRASWIRYYYDILGRVIKQVTPIHNNKTQTTLYEYDGLTTTITTPNNHTKIIKKNSLDETLEIIDNNNNKITYSYDAMGNLVKTDAEGKISIVKYDNLGRKIYLKTPENGETRYYYNGFGELIKQVDNKGIVTTFKYDKLGRVISKKAGSKKITYSYDNGNYAKGKVVKISSNDGWTKEFEYNSLSQLKSKILKIDNQELKESYNYDEIGRLKELIYPSGMRLKYSYTLEGYLDQISIPKKDVWDYKFIKLEESLEKVAKYIFELESKADEIERNIAFYDKKSQEFRLAANKLFLKIKKENADVRRLRYLANYMARKSSYYRNKALQMRRKSNDYYSRFGNTTLKYVRSVGGYYYYKNTDCVSRNWKGHCRKRNNYYVYIPKWIIRGRSRYCVSVSKWKKRCYWGPKRYINVSREYAYWANKYELYANIYNNRKNYYNYKANKLQKQVNNDNKLYQDYINKAKEYAKMAKEQSDILLKIETELETQIKTKKHLEEQYNERLKDESNIVIYSATNYDANGRVQAELYGNSLLTTNYYNVDGTINNVKVGIGKELFANVNYTYDDRNNLLSREDTINKTKENFSYDNLDRIISWKLTSKHIKKDYSYAYDKWGNMTYKSDVGFMYYDNNNRLIGYNNPLTNKSFNGFKYDKNGNMIKSYNNQSFTYNEFNKVELIKYSNGYDAFIYDEGDNIVKEEDSFGRIIYKLPDYELEFKKEGSKEHIFMRHHIYANNKEVALHIKHLIDSKKQVDRTLYFHKDILGSTILTTDNLKNILEKVVYSPYGKKIEITNNKLPKTIANSSLPNFTGHHYMGDSNLVNMKARVYDPFLGRFLSPDTIVPDSQSMEGFNRYAYVYNNPLKYVDPDGHFPWLFALGAALFTIGATSDDPLVRNIGMFVGSLMMGTAIKGWFPDDIMMQGATRGFATSVLSGQDIGQIFTSTVTGGLNAKVTNYIGHGNDGSALFGNDFATMLAHGLAQGAFSAIRGGKFKTGLVSGMASKLSGIAMRNQSLDSGTKLTVASIIGGLASKASGGDFFQGAVSAMFVYLYNELKNGKFKSPNQAAKYAIKSNMHIKNKEVGGYILIDKKGFYRYTLDETMDPTMPHRYKFNYRTHYYNGMKVIGYWHTHPYKKLKINGKMRYFDPDRFSKQDIKLINSDTGHKYGWLHAYVGTYSGYIFHYSGLTNTIELIGNWK